LILQSPLALLLLLLIPVLILLHAIRTRRRDATVSSLLLWQQALKETGRRFHLKRILRNLSLLLQIAATVLLATALAQPAVLRDNPEQRNLVLIVDTSASMKSREGSRTRMEAAKGIILQALGELGEGSRVLLIESRARPVLRSPFTSDRRALRERIMNLEATDEPGSMRDAFLMALSLAEAERRDEVWIATDGAFDPFEEIALAGRDVRLLETGGAGGNVAVTRFQFRSLPVRSREYEILVEVSNLSEDPTEAPLRLTIDGRPYLEDSVSLAPMEDRILIYPYRGLLAETAVAELDVRDPLPTDDRAYAVLSASRGIRILLLSPGNPFLEAALSVYPNARVDRALADRDYGDYDLVVFDRIRPPPLVSGNYLLVAAGAGGLPVREIGVLENPSIVSWDRSHPVLQSLTLTDVEIRSAVEVDVEEGGQILIQGRGSPLMIAHESGRLRTLYLAFDPLQSDLPLKTAFPVLIGNIVQWFAPGGITSAARQVQAGSPYAVNPRGFKFDVRRPDGTTETVAPPSSPYLYENTDTVGIYTAVGSEMEESFAVNLVDRKESDIRPRFQIEAARPAEAPEETDTAKSRRPFAFVFLLLCLAILLAEGVHWLRR